jgi:hypothetical protein
MIAGDSFQLLALCPPKTNERSDSHVIANGGSRLR